MVILFYKIYNINISKKFKFNLQNNNIIKQHNFNKGKGVGHKYLYRKIDFRRNAKFISGKVITIEYDPNRNAYICLIHYVDGKKRYILHPKGIKIKDNIVSGVKVPIAIGNSLPLTKYLTLGLILHNIEIISGKGIKIARISNSIIKYIYMINHNIYILRLPSNKINFFFKFCLISIGQILKINK
nr:ribosomal protein L2 [Thismia huangii]